MTLCQVVFHCVDVAQWSVSFAPGIPLWVTFWCGHWVDASFILTALCTERWFGILSPIQLWAPGSEITGQCWYNRYSDLKAHSCWTFWTGFILGQSANKLLFKFIHRTKDQYTSSPISLPLRPFSHPTYAPLSGSSWSQLLPLLMLKKKNPISLSTLQFSLSSLAFNWW